MQQSVGVAAVQLAGVSGKQRPVIQNLGPGTLYLGEDNTVSTGNGLQLPVGAVFEYASAIANDTAVWAVSSLAATDVRVLALGG